MVSKSHARKGRRREMKNPVVEQLMRRQEREKARKDLHNRLALARVQQPELKQTRPEPDPRATRQQIRDEYFSVELINEKLTTTPVRKQAASTLLKQVP